MNDNRKRSMNISVVTPECGLQHLPARRRRSGMTLGILGIITVTSLFACPVLAASPWLQNENGSTATTPAAGEPASSQGFFEIVFAGGPVGIVIIVILASLSITSAYLIIDHLLSVRRNDVMPSGLGDAVQQHLSTRNWGEAKKCCTENPSVLAFILLHGISEIEYGWSAVEKALEDALAEQSARLYRKIEYLSVIGNIAPMVGLLGTVIGMIMAFQQVAATQATAGAPQLAEGIYQALITTVGGLIVAIPSIGAFAVFRNRVDQFMAESAYVAQHVFGSLRRKKS